jgi:hypothetical protein
MEAAEKCFRAIGEFLAPGGASIYCFDFVLQGIAQEYDLMSGRNILSHQAQLENRPTETGFYDLLERLKGDVETFFPLAAGSSPLAPRPSLREISVS